ncbi:hypothetical protein M3175_07975 [Robertmurraya korlensis]|uniref:hypothetical protein n=1 Tax=Robertmurraya korlensis TaxID=519977 RepID=UPI00203D92B0|nr:hypothetical protein [Robertmurraya korlensis]MCM3600665.1 hypothetical protein [Robertmurraya korlensis]
MKTVQERLLQQVKNINDTVENIEMTDEFKVVAIGVMKEKINEMVDELITSLNA